MATAHPAPTVIAKLLRQVADDLEQPRRRCAHRGDCTPACRRPMPAGDLALELTALLADRGWPTSTLGTGVAGSSDDTSTERAALDPDRLAHLHARLTHRLRRIWADAVDIQGTLAEALAHADDADPIPAGRGHCLACTRFCVGDGNDRLRGGWCHACVEAWRRWLARQPVGMGQRSDFVRWRREQLGVVVDDHPQLATSGAPA